MQFFLKKFKFFACCGIKCEDINRWWKIELQIMENKVTRISVFMTCILTAKDKDSSECQKYDFKSTVLYMKIVKPVENSHKKWSRVSVVTSTWTCKIKTYFVQVVFADCSPFRTDHCCTSFALKVFLHMVNIWSLSLQGLTFKPGEREMYCGHVWHSIISWNCN